MGVITVNGREYPFNSESSIAVKGDEVWVDNKKLPCPDSPGVPSSQSAVECITDDTTSPFNLFIDSHFDSIKVNSVVVKSDGRIFVDGVEYVKKEDPFENSIMPPLRETTVSIEGAIRNLHINNCSTVEVHGPIQEDFIVTNGGVVIKGDIKGDVNADGDIQCNKICGDVNVKGSLQCDHISGDVIRN